MEAAGRFPWSRVTPLGAAEVDVVAYDAPSGRAVRCRAALRGGAWEASGRPRAASEGGRLVRDGLDEAIAGHAARWAEGNGDGLAAAAGAVALRECARLAAERDRLGRLAARARARAAALRATARAHATAWSLVPPGPGDGVPAAMSGGGLRAMVALGRGGALATLSPVPGEPPWPLRPGPGAPRAHPSGELDARDGFVPHAPVPGRGDALADAALSFLAAALRRPPPRLAPVALAVRCHLAAREAERAAEGLDARARIAEARVLERLEASRPPAAAGGIPAAPIPPAVAPPVTSPVPWSRAAVLGPGRALVLVHDVGAGASLQAPARRDGGAWVQDGPVRSRPFGARRDAEPAPGAWDALARALDGALGPEAMERGLREAALHRLAGLAGEVSALGARLERARAALAEAAGRTIPAGPVRSGVELPRYALEVVADADGATVALAAPIRLGTGEGAPSVAPSFRFAPDGTLRGANPDWDVLAGAGAGWRVWAELLLADAATAARSAAGEAAGRAVPDPAVGAMESEVMALEARMAELRARAGTGDHA